ncbi:MAG: DUF3459 domain-containing protein [Anaerolineae bacterium]|nr:DUF3459 domain-containing protein [Anaerolineae bacterium]
MPYSLHWTAGLHHDGSALYVSNPLPSAGERVTVRLRTPVDAPIRAIFVRTVPDGEGHHEPLRRVEQDTVSAWWSAEITMTMPVMHYRFKVMSSEGAYWLNALGVSRSDPLDHNDFKLLADFDSPDWVEDSVFYQIFPDRFHNGDPALNVPEGAWTKGRYRTRMREWGLPPLSHHEGGNLDYYGGDLPGIAQKLDYLQDLGVTALYLNPIFTAYSNHRYNIADFNQVDPYMGGETALVELRQALDRAGMRLVLDVTPNHCGSQHPWFTAAQQDANAPTADYFTFHQRPNDYESWLGHGSLPKLNYRSPALRMAMYRTPDSVLRRWLNEPYRIDGWRMDVANMTARHGMNQLAHEVWREIRGAIKGDHPQSFIFGESFFDGTPYLQGDQLDAVMNYQGFTMPLWAWLPGRPIDPEHIPAWFDPLPLPAEVMAEQWKHFMAAVPWAITRQQFNQLGSHDTPRILTVVNGDKRLLGLGVTLLMTYPGVPNIYYGDEIGMEGAWDPDNRRCMRWDESTWDTGLRAHYQRLIRLRRESPALRHGGFQHLYAADGLLVYQRQSAEQRLVVVGYCGPELLVAATVPVRQAGLADGAQLKHLFGSRVYTVAEGCLHLSDLKPGTALVLEAV